MKKLTIATDSFKGSLSSIEATSALAEGVLSVCPTAIVEQIPLADGGEGSVDVLLGALAGRRVELTLSDPLGRPIVGHYALLTDGVAVVEVAQAVGLGLLSLSERNPMVASSRGVGQMIRHAIEQSGARRVVVCLGGSSTCDSGVGMLAELGFELFDSEGCGVEPLACNLTRVATIVATEAVQRLLKGVEFEVATDVMSPLCGPRGAACLFAPQKGASPSDVEALEEGAAHFAEVVLAFSGRDMRSAQGAGAAGGMGGALWALLGGEVCSGGELIAQRCRFAQRAEGSCVVITGEGRIDAQTMLGKLPSVVLQMAKGMALPVVAVGGSVEWSEELQTAGFEQIVEATPEGMELSCALQKEVAQANLRCVGRRLAERWLL